MPRLKQLTCSIELGVTNSPLREYGTTYNDGHVETFIIVPAEEVEFSIHLTSERYIAPGIAFFVYIDGQYQCNRNRRGLVIPQENTPLNKYQVDLRVRQKESKQPDGSFLGRGWTFHELNTVSADMAPRINPTFLHNIGTIEIVVLRCKETPAVGPRISRNSDPASTHKILREEGNKQEGVRSLVIQRKTQSINKAASKPVSFIDILGVIEPFDGAADDPYIDRFDNLDYSSMGYCTGPHQQTTSHAPYSGYARPQISHDSTTFRPGFSKRGGANMPQVNTKTGARPDSGCKIDGTEIPHHIRCSREVPIPADFHGHNPFEKIPPPRTAGQRSKEGPQYVVHNYRPPVKERFEPTSLASEEDEPTHTPCLDSLPRVSFAPSHTCYPGVRASLGKFQDSASRDLPTSKQEYGMLQSKYCPPKNIPTDFLHQREAPRSSRSFMGHTPVSNQFDFPHSQSWYSNPPWQKLQTDELRHFGLLPGLVRPMEASTSTYESSALGGTPDWTAARSLNQSLPQTPKSFPTHLPASGAKADPSPWNHSNYAHGSDNGALQKDQMAQSHEPRSQQRQRKGLSGASNFFEVVSPTNGPEKGEPMKAPPQVPGGWPDYEADDQYSVHWDHDGKDAATSRAWGTKSKGDHDAANADNVSTSGDQPALDCVNASQLQEISWDDSMPVSSKSVQPTTNGWKDTGVASNNDQQPLIGFDDPKPAPRDCQWEMEKADSNAALEAAIEVADLGPASSNGRKTTHGVSDSTVQAAGDLGEIEWGADDQRPSPIVLAFDTKSEAVKEVEPNFLNTEQPLCRSMPAGIDDARSNTAYMASSRPLYSPRQSSKGSDGAASPPHPKPYWGRWTKKPESLISETATVKKEKIRDPFVGPAEPLPRFSEGEAKKVGVEHQVKIGKAAPYVHLCARPEYLDTMDQPYAVFSFKYRSKKIVEGIFNLKIRDDGGPLKAKLAGMSREQLVEELLRVKANNSPHSRDALSMTAVEKMDAWNAASPPIEHPKSTHTAKISQHSSKKKQPTEPFGVRTSTPAAPPMSFKSKTVTVAPAQGEGEWDTGKAASIVAQQESNWVTLETNIHASGGEGEWNTQKPASKVAAWDEAPVAATGEGAWNTVPTPAADAVVAGNW